MKYSYTLIVFIILILYQVLLTFALDDHQQSNDQYDGFKSEHKSLSRNKRQIFRGKKFSPSLAVFSMLTVSIWYQF